MEDLLEICCRTPARWSNVFLTIDYDSRCSGCYLGHIHTICDHCEELARHASYGQVRLNYSSGEALRTTQEAQRSAAANWLQQHLPELLNGTPPPCSCAQCR